jgi:putative transcriptional regulator
VCPEDFDPSEHPELTPRERAELERGLGRLLGAVEELPLRYAPFYGRLAALWDLPEDDVHATLVHAGTPDAFARTLLPGVRRMSVRGGANLAGATLDLLRLEPGARFPQHRHEGHEVVLVLEGSYRDAGRDFEPGDAQAMAAGSVHALSVSLAGPCIAAVVSRGFAFTTLPLRLLQLIAKNRG